MSTTPGTSSRLFALTKTSTRPLPLPPLPLLVVLFFLICPKPVKIPLRRLQRCLSAGVGTLISIFARNRTRLDEAVESVRHTMGLCVATMGKKVMEVLWWRPRWIEEHFAKQGIGGLPTDLLVGFFVNTILKLPVVPGNLSLLSVAGWLFQSIQLHFLYRRKL